MVVFPFPKDALGSHSGRWGWAFPLLHQCGRPSLHPIALAQARFAGFWPMLASSGCVTGLWDQGFVCDARESTRYMRGESLGCPFCCITEVVISHSPVSLWDLFWCPCETILKKGTLKQRHPPGCCFNVLRGLRFLRWPSCRSSLVRFLLRCGVECVHFSAKDRHC